MSPEKSQLETKYCPKCDQTLPVSAFGRNKRRRDGLMFWCKPCKRAYDKARYEKEPPRIAAHISDRQLFEGINRRWAPDGLGGYHWRYEGTGINGKDSVPILQRLSQIMDDRPLPMPVTAWCWSEYPQCCNPDHLTSHGEVPLIGLADFEGDFDETGGQSMQWLFAEANETMAHIVYRLDHLNGDWDKVPAAVKRLEDLGSRILREAGFNRWGYPYQRNNPAKGRRKRLAA